MDAKTLLSKARTALILSSPFFATVALHLELKEDQSCQGAYTDSKVLGYNPLYIRSLQMTELKTLICHLVMHIVLLHPFRRQERDPEIWNLACDYAVNPLLKRGGFYLPNDALIDARFDNLDAEKIYELLLGEQNANDQAGTRSPSVSGTESGSGGNSLMGEVKDYVPDPLTQDVPAPQQEQDCKILCSQAANAARQQGNLPAYLNRIVTKTLNPQLPWQEILARFITESACNDYNWRTPNKRYLSSGFYLPALRNPSLGTIAVLIDTSMSIRQKELDSFVSELKAILSAYPETQVEVLYVDSEVAGSQSVNVYNLDLEVKGGGGTDYVPGFVYIEQEGLNPVCAIYFTDGYCRSFPEEPDYPVLWVISSRLTFQPPFGEVITINNP